jgi:alkylation response protein AidB-like acyl-CoA dehydrogenase
MQAYTAPLRDMQFVIHELHGATMLSDKPEEVTPDVINSILDEAAKFMSSVLLPLNSPGDAEGCHYLDGTVRTPRGFTKAYSGYAAGGYASLDADPAHGGQGLPVSLRKLVEEMRGSCNVAFSMYPGLSQGAYLTIRRCATQQMQDLYLPRLVDGTWSGTMCLTEAHCGTDLGLVRTQAIPQPDGSFHITGSKIFIT